MNKTTFLLNAVYDILIIAFSMVLGKWQTTKNFKDYSVFDLDILCAKNKIFYADCVSYL